MHCKMNNTVKDSTKGYQQTPPVNYIQHLTGFYELIARDNRLTTAHISLYMALFQFWNMNRFQNPISISRNEMMEISKIGSTNTYTKCLKELDVYGYIQYLPSFNPLKGSTVNLFDFDKSTDKGTDTSCDKGTNKATDKGSERLVRPSINSINKKKHINSINKERENSSNEFSHAPKTEKKKITSGACLADQKMTIPNLEEVKKYFLEKENASSEAERFFNHFESNGWLVGGKTPMKDWKAAARNWMIRSKEFQNEKTPTNPLSTNPNKDYSIPL